MECTVFEHLSDIEKILHPKSGLDYELLFGGLESHRRWLPFRDLAALSERSGIADEARYQRGLWKYISFHPEEIRQELFLRAFQGKRNPAPVAACAAGERFPDRALPILVSACDAARDISMREKFISIIGNQGTPDAVDFLLGQKRRVRNETLRVAVLLALIHGGRWEFFPELIRILHATGDHRVKYHIYQALLDIYDRYYDDVAQFDLYQLDALVGLWFKELPDAVAELSVLMQLILKVMIGNRRESGVFEHLPEVEKALRLTGEYEDSILFSALGRLGKFLPEAEFQRLLRFRTEPGDVLYRDGLWEYISFQPQEIRQKLFLQALKEQRDLFEVSTFALDEKFPGDVLPVLVAAYHSTRDQLVRRDLCSIIGNTGTSDAVDFLLTREKRVRNEMLRAGVLLALVDCKRRMFLDALLRLLSVTEACAARGYICHVLLEIYERHYDDVAQFDLYQLDTLVGLWRKEVPRAAAEKEALLRLILGVYLKRADAHAAAGA